ncbi:ErpC protein (plasmid) [Borreliella californiensis]|uniref:DNA repair exonuclease SbcCD ATPase subunit n=2 Tax=Borreliella californiensis TaxID=373543 RepID=A0A7W9ZNR9_9SPIR|nr:ErpC protein [Borreliella californiensis]MBB6213777.1 DNA repair exonuclease SbcCD ATPase subunit [Borreliella californiensis]
MNKKRKMFTICVVFVIIISCKNYTSGEDVKKSLEQDLKGKVKGFLYKILDPVKDKITSSGSKVDEVAKKLQEEEDKVKYIEEVNEQAVDLGEEREENKEKNEKVINAEEKEEKNKEESNKVVDLGEKETEVKKETKEDEDKEKIEEQKQKEKKAQERKQRQEKKAQERKQRQEKKAQERKQRQEQQEKRRAESKIKTLTDKIDRVNGNIDNIERQTSVKPKAVIDKITGPVYDYFTDDDKKAIYKTWGDLEEENKGLGKLLKELSDTRHKLRTKLNVDNKPYTGGKEPDLKENVNVIEIKSNLEELKLKLEGVKSYLEDRSKFNEIKGYITDSYDD